MGTTNDPYSQDVLRMILQPQLLGSGSAVSPIFDLVATGCQRVLFGLGVGVGGIAFNAANRFDFTILAGDDPGALLPILASAAKNKQFQITTDGIVASVQSPAPAGVLHRVGTVQRFRYWQVQAAAIGAHPSPTIVYGFCEATDAFVGPVGD